MIAICLDTVRGGAQPASVLPGGLVRGSLQQRRKQQNSVENVACPIMFSSTPFVLLSWIESSSACPNVCPPGTGGTYTFIRSMPVLCYRLQGCHRNRISAEQLLITLRKVLTVLFPPLMTRPSAPRYQSSLPHRSSTTLSVCDFNLFFYFQVNLSCRCLQRGRGDKKPKKKLDYECSAGASFLAIPPPSFFLRNGPDSINVRRINLYAKKVIKPVSLLLSIGHVVTIRVVELTTARRSRAVDETDRRQTEKEGKKG